MMAIPDILREIQRLSEAEKLTVLHQLIDVLAKEKKSGRERSLTELAGLGNEIWKGIDIDDYLRNERSWD